jgi:hypothetical protein
VGARPSNENQFTFSDMLEKAPDLRQYIKGLRHEMRNPTENSLRNIPNKYLEAVPFFGSAFLTIHLQELSSMYERRYESR